MDDASLKLYEAINQYSVLEDFIENGQAEDLYLECKAPSNSKLGRDQKKGLAKAISGFSNAAGGVIIWGIGTAHHGHSGLDVLIQIEPIGACKDLVARLSSSFPMLTIPPVLNSQSKTIKKKASDTKGVVVTHIPKHRGDPVQSSQDNLFYFRSGAQFTVAPYEMIQRLFLSTISPDLFPNLAVKLIKLKADDIWEVPIIVGNRSSAVGQHVIVAVEVLNPSACEKISVEHFQDESKLNPGRRTFHNTFEGVIHRGLDQMLGTVEAKMKVIKRAKRLLRLGITIYSDNMRARSVEVIVQLAKRKVSMLVKKEHYLY